MTRFTPLLLALASACRPDAQPDDTDTDRETDAPSDTDTDGTTDSDTDDVPTTPAFDLTDPGAVQRLLYIGGSVFDVLINHQAGVPSTGACAAPAESEVDGKRVRTWSGPCSDAGVTLAGTAVQRVPVDGGDSQRWELDELDITASTGALLEVRATGTAEYTVLDPSEEDYADQFRVEDMHLFARAAADQPPYQDLRPDGVHIVELVKDHPASVSPAIYHEISWELAFPNGTRATFHVELDETRDGCSPGKTSVNEGVGTLTVNDHTLVLDFTSDEACTGCYAATLDGEALVDPMCVFVR